MNNIQTIMLNNITIDYKSYDKNYVICFLDNIDNNIEIYIEQLYNIIYPSFYKSYALKYDNCCGNNAIALCNAFKQNNKVKSGRIIIYSWSNSSKLDIDNITKIFGSTSLRVGATYHALGYLEVQINYKWYFIAIETTIELPYKLQFFVGNSKKELDVVLSARYLCDKYAITYDCDIFFTDVISNANNNKGGKKKKNTRKYKLRLKNANNKDYYKNKQNNKKYTNRRTLKVYKD
jgi:hypothetical protein